VPIGFGAATTGGAGGATVTVSSTDAFLSAIQSAEPLTVQVDGSIALAGMNRVASDKTIVGVGTSARLIGGGLNIRDVDNVIVRNLTISGSDDNISIDESTNVWVDHNDLSNADDGALDIKHAADFVTVSWNHFHDQDKNMRVTYHHNWFDGTNQRKSPGALRQPGARLQQLLQRQQRLRRRLHHGRRRPRRGQLLRERGRPLPLGRGQLRSRLAGGERQPLRQLGDG
jgi:pectate lyase